MSRGVFVTGTDTGAGKTFASCALLAALRAHGLRASGMKPVASGCIDGVDGLRSEDALALIAASDPVPSYADCNPYALLPPIAPHVAARDAQRTIELAPIRAAHARIEAACDRVIVEGVGGWLAPLSDTLMQADLAHALALPVVLVVGLRLGCINHALLTARAIAQDGCRQVGWIANRVDADMLRVEDTIDTLRARLPSPLLGVLPHSRATPDPRLLNVTAL